MAAVSDRKSYKDAVYDTTNYNKKEQIISANRNSGIDKALGQCDDFGLSDQRSVSSSHKSAGRRHNDKQAKPVCRDFVAGSCKYGDKCRFSHTQSPVTSGVASVPVTSGGAPASVAPSAEELAKAFLHITAHPKEKKIKPVDIIDAKFFLTLPDVKEESSTYRIELSTLAITYALAFWLSADNVRLRGSAFRYVLIATNTNLIRFDIRPILRSPDPIVSILLYYTFWFGATAFLLNNFVIPWVTIIIQYARVFFFSLKRNYGGMESGACDQYPGAESFNEVTMMDKPEFQDYGGFHTLVRCGFNAYQTVKIDRGILHFLERVAHPGMVPSSHTQNTFEFTASKEYPDADQTVLNYTCWVYHQRCLAKQEIRQLSNGGNYSMVFERK